MTFSIEWSLLIYFVLVVSLRLVAQYLGAKSKKIITLSFFVPIGLIIAHGWYAGLESTLGVLSYEGLRLPFLILITGFSLITLLMGIKRELVHNFFTSLHYLFAVIVIGATDFITLTVGILLCGLLAVTHTLLSRKVVLSDFSTRLFAIQLISLISLIITFLCFLMATGSTSLLSIANADTTFLLISICFVVFIFLLESGSLSFSYILTDIGSKAGNYVYSIVLMNKFLVLGTCLFLINDFSQAVNGIEVYRFAIQLICAASILFSLIGGFNNKCSASIVSKLFSINSVMVLAVFANSSESDVLYNAFLFFGTITLATVVCFDRKPVCLTSAVPFYGTVGDLATFSICLGSLSLFPLNSLFVKRFSLLVSAKEMELDALTIIFVVALVVLFISSSNLITSIARRINSSPSSDKTLLENFVEWGIVVVIVFGGLLA